MKLLDKRMPFDSSSSLNVRCCKLWLKSFGNIFYNACYDPSCPFNNCKDVKTPLSAIDDKFRNSFFIDVYEILGSVFECIESDSIFKSAIKNHP